jgi:23S rRNA (cytosine1962-C5)-methyltransferase
MIKDTFPSLMDQALIKRKELCARLEAEKTDAYRLFHGIAEGLPGLTIDRYGSLILIQTFREPLATEDLQFIEGILRSRLAFTFELAYNHRAKNAKQFFEEWHHPVPEALAEIQCREFGLNYLIRARHPGIDPWLFRFARRSSLRASACERQKRLESFRLYLQRGTGRRRRGG